VLQRLGSMCGKSAQTGGSGGGQNGRRGRCSRIRRRSCSSGRSSLVRASLPPSRHGRRGGRRGRRHLVRCTTRRGSPGATTARSGGGGLDVARWHSCGSGSHGARRPFLPIERRRRRHSKRVHGRGRHPVHPRTSKRSRVGAHQRGRRGRTLRQHLRQGRCLRPGGAGHRHGHDDSGRERTTRARAGEMPLCKGWRGRCIGAGGGSDDSGGERHAHAHSHAHVRRGDARHHGHHRLH